MLSAGAEGNSMKSLCRLLCHYECIFFLFFLMFSVLGQTALYLEKPIEVCLQKHRNKFWLNTENIR